MCISRRMISFQQDKKNETVWCDDRLALEGNVVRQLPQGSVFKLQKKMKIGRGGERRRKAGAAKNRCMKPLRSLPKWRIGYECGLWGREEGWCLCGLRVCYQRQRLETVVELSLPRGDAKLQS